MASGTEWQSSEPFKFLVDDRPVFIHEALVSAVSDPLSQLVHGDFEEAQSREATLPGVDFDTFTRFVHWAYTGFYLPAEATLQSTQDETSDTIIVADVVEDKESKTKFEDETAFDDLWAYSFTSKKNITKKKELSWGVNHETTFQRLQRAFSELKVLRPGDWRAPAKIPADYNQEGDLTEAFLSHVRVYVFADEKMIEPLQRYVLRELHRTLQAFKLDPVSAKELIPMIEYVYNHTPQRLGLQEPLRSLVSKYIGSRMNILIAVKEFRALFQNPDFAEDFCEELTVYFCMQLS